MEHLRPMIKPRGPRRPDAVALATTAFAVRHVIVLLARIAHIFGPLSDPHAWSDARVPADAPPAATAARIQSATIVAIANVICRLT